MFSNTYDWSYDAKLDPSLRHGHPLFCPRGKTLGGSSSINGMVYTRGHPSDYDRWAELSNEGWSFAECLAYFREAENNVRGAKSITAPAARCPFRIARCITHLGGFVEAPGKRACR